MTRSPFQRLNVWTAEKLHNPIYNCKGHTESCSCDRSRRSPCRNSCTNTIYGRIIRWKLYLQSHHKSQHKKYTRQQLDMLVCHFGNKCCGQMHLKIELSGYSRQFGICRKDWSSICWKKHIAKCKALGLCSSHWKLSEWPSRSTDLSVINMLWKGA